MLHSFSLPYIVVAFQTNTVLLRGTRLLHSSPLESHTEPICREYEKCGLQILKSRCEVSAKQSRVTLTSQWLFPSQLLQIKSIYDHLKDTEFPGVVARPIGSFKTSSDYHYQTMRCNVDLLKIIQVGLTIADEDGNYPQDISTWQFNFRFSVKYA